MDGHALRWPVYEAMVGRISSDNFDEQDPVLATVWLLETVDGEVRNGGFSQLVFNLRRDPMLLGIAVERLRAIGADQAAALLDGYLGQIVGEKREYLEREGPFDLPDEIQDLSAGPTFQWLDLRPSVRVQLGRYLDEHLEEPAVQELIESDRFRTPDFDLDEALVDACYEIAPERAKELLKKGANPNARDASDKSPLDRLSDRSDDFEACAEIFDALVDAGADVNAANEGGDTALHWCEDPAFVELLLEAGADPNARSDGDTTPLHLATAIIREDEPFDADLFDALLDGGADPTLLTDDGRDLFWFLAENHEAFDYFDNRGIEPHAEADEGGLHGETALHHAAHQGKADMVEFLLEQGADPNVRLRAPDARSETHAGGTPLDVARSSGNEKIAEALEEAGGRTGDRVGWGVVLRARGERAAGVVEVLSASNYVDVERDELAETVASAPLVAGQIFDPDDFTVKLPRVVAKDLGKRSAEELTERLCKVGADAVAV
jgi:ankyrin repeat protein